MSDGRDWSETYDLARIHDVERIERTLDRAHGVQRRLPMLGQKVSHLALADPMLAGAGPVHRQGPLGQAFEEPANPRYFLFVAHIHHQSDMEIAVADMADNRGQQLAF